MWIVQTRLDPIVKNLDGIVSPFQPETKPRSLNSNVVHTSDIDVGRKFLRVNGRKFLRVNGRIKGSSREHVLSESRR